MANKYTSNKNFKDDDMQQNGPYLSFDCTIEDYINYYDKKVLLENPASYWAWLFMLKDHGKHEKQSGAPEWRYANDILYLAQKFLSLQLESQKLIEDARRANIQWRGDDMNYFELVIKHTISWRKKSDMEKSDVMEIVRGKLGIRKMSLQCVSSDEKNDPVG